MTGPQDFENAADAAVARRLSRLRGVPVDTSGLEKALAHRLPAPPRRARRGGWWASLAGVAATLLLVGTIGVALLQGREAQASSVQMAQMHQDIVAGRIPTMRAGSIDEANRAIAALAGNFPTLPTPPETHTMACCMRNVGKKKVACVLLDAGTVPVTMAVASAADVESPTSGATVRGGVTYHVEAVGELNMVMTERDGRWICFVGALPVARLMDLAAGVKF